MSTNFQFLDYLVFIIYAVVILGVGLWVSRDKKGHQKNAEDYFLASKSLPWWAIGASLIAANISAEQFIGMSGSGFASGLAIASYEWMAALTLIIVGKSNRKTRRRTLCSWSRGPFGKREAAETASGSYRERTLNVRALFQE